MVMNASTITGLFDPWQAKHTGDDNGKNNERVKRIKTEPIDLNRDGYDLPFSDATLFEEDAHGCPNAGVLLTGRAANLSLEPTNTIRPEKGHPDTLRRRERKS